MSVWLVALSAIYYMVPAIANLFNSNAAAGFGTNAEQSPQHMTGYFVLFILAALFNGFNVRDEGFGIFRGLNENKGFIRVFLIIALVQAFIVNAALIPLDFFGWISQMFSCTPFSAVGWCLVILLAVTMIPVDLIRKLFVKAFTKKESAE